MQRNWHESPPSSRPENGHTVKEVEHRFTDLEAGLKESTADRMDLHEIVTAHAEKLQLHEKAILGLFIALSALLQEQFPRLAALLKAALL